MTRVATYIGLVASLSVNASICAQEVFVDLNALTVSAGGTFGGVAHSGDLTLSTNSNSSLVSVRTPTVTATPPSVGLAAVNGVIRLDAGNVVGGDLSITALDGSSYIAQIGVGGSVFRNANGFYSIDGLTFSGEFPAGMFAGVNVSAWPGNQLVGSFFLHKYLPDAGGVSNNVDLDLVIVPAPAGVMLFGLVGSAAFSRRRR